MHKKQNNKGGKVSKLGLALGGGGARGLAHIGVLKVLEEEKIKIQAITGCSMGALVGGLYAYFNNAYTLEQFITNIIKDPKFLDLGFDKFRRMKIYSDKNYFEKITDFIESRVQAFKVLTTLSYFEKDETNKMFEIIPSVTLSELKIKFSAIATDLISGEEIHLSEGNLRDAIKASSAIPGIFPPVEMGNYLLVDGSASESVPVRKVKELGADRVLAVNVMRSLKKVNPPKNIIEVLYRTEDITSYHLSVLRLSEADLIISPEVKNYSWADFVEYEKIIRAGEEAAKQNIKEIKELISRSKFRINLRKIVKKFTVNE